MPLTNIILARLLATDIFGIVASINIIIALVEIFADSGFSKYLVQADFESDIQFELHKSVSFWTSTVISRVMFLLIVIFRDSLATLIRKLRLWTCSCNSSNSDTYLWFFKHFHRYSKKKF
jgi:O-antigen/teichoic acid export membrane protein